MKTIPSRIRRAGPLAGCAVAILLGACIPSVRPFYTDKDLVDDPRLVGEWNDGEDAVWAFTPRGESGAGYHLRITESGGDVAKKGEFRAHLFKLGEHHFLDLAAGEVELADDQIDLVSMSLVPGHLLVRVYQFEPTLKLAFTDPQWLEDFLEENPDALAHHKEDDRLVLVATTGDMQTFILAHLVDGELFEGPDKAGELNRGVRAVEAPAAPEDAPAPPAANPTTP